MAMVAIAGAPGSPGATTTALALLLTWPLPAGRRVLLAECDPDGGAVLPGALQGRVEGAWGLRHLAVADRRGLLAQSVWEQLIDLSPQEDGTRLLLPGVTDPAQTPGLAYTWDPLARLFASWDAAGIDVVVDLGRNGLQGGPGVLARRADAVLMTVRGTLRSLSGAQPRLAALREELDARGTGADTLGVVLIGEGPYPASDVQRHLGVPVVATLPHAPGHARVLSDGDGESSDRRFVRSELMRGTRSLSDAVRAGAEHRRRRLTVPQVAAQEALQQIEQQAPHQAQPSLQSSQPAEWSQPPQSPQAPWPEPIHQAQPPQAPHPQPVHWGPAAPRPPMPAAPATFGTPPEGAESPDSATGRDATGAWGVTDHAR